MKKSYHRCPAYPPQMYYAILENTFWKEIEKHKIPNRDVIKYWQIANRWGSWIIDTSNYEQAINCKFTNSLSIIEHRHQIKRFVADIIIKEIKAQINNPVNNAVGWKV